MKIGLYSPWFWLWLCFDGFDIVMQISHVVCRGANIDMVLFLGRLARLDDEVCENHI